MVVISQKCTSWSEKTIDYLFCARFGAIFRAKVIANAMDYFFDRFYAPFAIENSRKFKSSIPSREKTCMDTAYLLINPTWQNT
ncbi:hypothetical protein ACXO9Z_07245 [Lactobacillus delbrueckii subsp. bulgaricus]